MSEEIDDKLVTELHEKIANEILKNDEMILEEYIKKYNMK